jgi:hypothetical protein
VIPYSTPSETVPSARALTVRPVVPRERYRTGLIKN